VPQPLWGCGGYDLRQLLVAVEQGCWVSGWVCVGVCGAMPGPLFGALGVMSAMPSWPEGGACQVNGGGLPRHCVQKSHKHKGSDRLRTTNPQARSESTGNRKRRNTVQLARVSFLLWGARAHCFFFFGTLFFFLAPVKN